MPCASAMRSTDYSQPLRTTLESSVQVLRQLCGEHRIPWSISDDARQLAQRLTDAMDEAATMAERWREAEAVKERSAAAAHAEYLMNEARLVHEAKEAAKRQQRRDLHLMSPSSLSTPRRAQTSSPSSSKPPATAAAAMASSSARFDRTTFVTVHVPQVDVKT